ncbi:AAA family ATPase [Streptomyces sp. NPDC003077]|uniref:AAA family ATPase n=1 Tax=Streptomyces sp. NPDC003077 TaxID=3154443 RepID=UPI0033A73E84
MSAPQHSTDAPLASATPEFPGAPHAPGTAAAGDGLAEGPWRRGGGVVVITGIQAAGKSTVAQALAERLPRSVHLRGDTFRRVIVRGQVPMSPDPDEDALAQLRLRYQLLASCADRYAAAGFTVIAQDVVLGHHLADLTTWITTRPLAVVVLAPRPDAVEEREAGRSKTAYGPDWSVAGLDAELRAHTPPIGLWLDTSGQTVEETVREVLDRAWSDGGIG